MCPLCHKPFSEDHDDCDHEAGWYRQWLGIAVGLLDDEDRNTFQRLLNESVA